MKRHWGMSRGESVASKCWLLLLIVFLAKTIFLPETSYAQVQVPSYELETIIKTGDRIDPIGNLVGTAMGTSINDEGKVTFTADVGGVNLRIIVKDRSTTDIIYPIAGELQMGQYMQLNNTNKVVFNTRDRRDGDTTIVRLDYTDRDNPVIAHGSNFFQTPYSLVQPYMSMNNNGGVVFAGELKVGGTALAFEDDNIRENGGMPDFQAVPIGGNPQFWPMISDTNRIIVRGGAAANANMVLFIDETLDEATAIPLATANEYRAIGLKPGISDDGRVGVFAADHLQEGKGIYGAAVNARNQAVLFRITGLSAGTDVNRRVAINHSADAGPFDYTVVYMALNDQGVLGIYTIGINVSNPIAGVLV
ncbi:MAG: hypothetical protein NUV91_07960, partial [Candidatus Omnitrophica bacterium]|nr:hypothetical protein [Candidatus Omnitrophota bacterium]